MANKDYYGILGVDKNASDDDIKSSYRKLAKKYHPDLYSNATEQEKKNAEEKFKEISHAYEVLSDPQKKAAYDQYGDENGPQMGAGGFGSGGFGFDMDDIFSSIFSGFGGGNSRSSNGPRRGQDILTNLTLSFDEAAFGIQKIIKVKRVEICSDCKGTGAKDASSYKTCPQCGGKGKITTTQRTPFGMFNTTNTCPQCGGKGKIITENCKTCFGHGRIEKESDVKVNIPAGIDNGQHITYAGEGHGGINGGERGSLIVEIKVQPHKLFVREGSDLFLEYPISFVDATLGTTIEVPTIYDKKEKIKIPDGTQSGTVFKIRNCGIKKIRGFDKGDLYVKVIVEVPKSISREQKKILEQFEKESEIKQYPLKKEFLDKIEK